ncbi:MAG: glycosyltransferase family 39 protein [Anaerolineales bacterium]|nr:glycosyltransferase family 39 protein [Anaerolineales bacterium]
METRREAESEPFPWLTLETVLYALLLILALALRLWRLDHYPLSDAEAAQSWPALQLYRGGPLGVASYSPLLLSLNALAFFLLGVNDFTARLAPALLGSLIVILPVTLRRQLGRRACLLAAALLAFSPTAVFLSRTLNSEIGLAAGALMVVTGFFNWTEDGRRSSLLLAAAGLALLLTSGPMVISVLIVFGLIIALKFSAFKALWQNGLDHLTATQATTPESQATSEDGQLSHLPTPNPQSPAPDPYPSLRHAGLFFLVSLVLLATAGLFNIGGLGILSGFLPEWLSRFNLQGRPDAGFNAVFLLTIYEPLLVLAGLAGLAYVLLEKDLLKQTLGGWFAGLVILDLVMIGRPTGNVILSLVPLAFLAAIALAELWHSLAWEGSWGNEGLLLVAGLVIGSFSYIGLTGWLVRTCNPDDTICQYAWLQPVAALGLFIIITIFFGFMTNGGAAARGAALAGVAIGLLAALSIGWRLNYGPLMNLAYQPLAGIPPSTGLMALTETLTRQSAERTGGQQTALDTTLAGVTRPALLWRLRDFEQLTQVGSAAEAQPTTAIITPANVELGMGQPYLGQGFTLDAPWSPVGLPAKELVNWLLYRDLTPPAQENQVILWLQPERN